MQVQRKPSVRKLGHPYRIQPAGLRLPELDGTGEETLLDGAEAVPVPVESGVCTFPGAIHGRSDEVVVPVYGEETVFCHLRQSLRAHKFRIFRIIHFEVLELILFQRSSAVADDAAYSLALRIVTGEILGNHFFRYQDISDLDDSPELIVV